MTVTEGRSSRQLRTQQLLMAALQEFGPATREDLSRLTGLSRSAVAAGVQSLLADHRLTEQAMTSPAGRSRGRPSSRLALATPAGPVIGIDFGHAHLRTAIAHTSGEVLAEQCVDIDVDAQPAQALDAAASIVRALLSAANTTIDQVLAVGACIPGPLDIETEVVHSPTILAEWVALNPQRELNARIGKAVTVGNDANMGARGELRFGAARNYRDFLYIKASHGIGTGLVLNGHAYRGSLGIAGEIGHTQLPGATNWCRCGSRGCLESVVSITEIRRQLAYVLTPEASLAPLSTLSGNPAAARVITDAGRTIGRVLADVCNCLNPAAIVLGGELGTAGEPLIGGVRESIDRYAQPAAAAVNIHTAELGTRAELMGAIATAIQQLETAIKTA
jgi:predicted NBD/HSP70 family sugar kinase